MKTPLALASLVSGALALLLGILPLMDVYFFSIVTVTDLLALVALVLGIIALVKKQGTGLAIAGLVCAFIAFLCPYIFSEAYALAIGRRAAESFNELKDSFQIN